MEVYRISRAAYKNDLTGTGAKMDGGRWNSIGNPVVYSSENQSLSLLETLVHISPRTVTSDLWVTTIHVPEDLELDRVDRANLPEGWNRYRVTPASQELGDRWLVQSKTLGLFVPSVISPIDCNVLLNPIHPGMRRIKIVEVQPLSIDPRLLRGNHLDWNP